MAASDDFCSSSVQLDNSNITDWLEFTYEYELPAFTKMCDDFLERADVAQIVQALGAERLDALPRRMATELLLRAAKHIPSPASQLSAGVCSVTGGDAHE